MAHELGSVSSFLVKRLGELLIEESTFLRGVSAQVKQMEIELNRMQCFLEAAEAKQVQGDQTVRNWVAEVRELSLDAEDVIATFVVKVAFMRRGGIHHVLKRYFCIFRESYARHKVGSEILDINKKIADLRISSQIYGIQPTTALRESSTSRSENDIRQSFAHEVEDIVELKEDVRTVVDQLVKKNCRVVAIWGMGGLGKTTLAKRVYNHSEVTDHFKCFAWAYISQQCKPKEVLEGILTKFLSSEPEEELQKIRELKFDELAEKLYHLQSEKKCLVILDDIWEGEAWDRLRPGFPNTSAAGSKILLTTRNREVALHVDQQCHPHRLRHLTDEESWELFLKKAFPRREEVGVDQISEVGQHSVAQEVREVMNLNVDPAIDQISEIVQHSIAQEVREAVNLNVDPPIESRLLSKEMMKLGKDMVKRCGGLPLALVVLGGLLATKSTLDEWQKVSRNLELRLRQGNSQGGVTSVLDLSFNDLPYHLKACFLCLSGLPEDEGIRPVKLIQRWMAEGFVSLPVRARVRQVNDETMLDVGMGYLDELRQRCMIQVGQLTRCSGRVKFYRLHDLIRDLCFLKAQEENFIKVIVMGEDSANTTSSSSSSTSIRRLGVYRMVDSRRRGYVKPLRIDEKWNLHPVRSCEFYFNSSENSDWQHVKSIIKGFKLLTFLDLENTKFSNERNILPKAIGNLIHLRYLSIRDSQIVGLPSSIGNLGFLETLDLRKNFFKIGYFGGTKVPNVLWRLEQLRHLYLPPEIDRRQGPFRVKLRLDGLSNLETLEGFDTRTCDVRSFSTLTNLRKLGISVDGPKDLAVILQSPSLSNSNLLLRYSSFNISGFSQTREEQVLLRQVLGYRHLHKLEINGSLTELPDAFPPNLTHLQLITHPRGSGLKEDPMPTLEKLPNLRSLTVKGEWEEMVFSAGGFSQLIYLEFINIDAKEWRVERGAMPCLLHLKIYEPKWDKIPDGLRFVTTLQKLEIWHASESLKKGLQEGGEDFSKIQHLRSFKTS